MENLKHILLLIAVILAIIFLGYWAFFTIEPGSIHIEKQKREEVEQKNKELTKEIEELKDQLAALQPIQEKENNQENEITKETVPAEKPTTTTTTNSKYQSLINKIQELITDNVYMKEKSRGTRVGTVQTFLNIYNNTSKKVDNDYGATTKADVIKFQKAVGLTADGEAGPSTFKKMIEWLQKQ